MLLHLLPQRATVRISCRGCGASSAAPESFSVADMARDVLAVADALDLAAFDLVGVSMGGMVAQEVALSEPERVKTLGLVSSAPWAGDNGRFVLTLIRDLVIGGDVGGAARVLANAAMTPSLIENQRAVVEATCRELARVPGIAANLVHLIDAILRFDVRKRLDSAAVPVAAVIATDDGIFAPECSSSLVSILPAAVVTTVTGGHCAFQIDPETPARALRDLWLSPASNG
jgi:3-oxoadipate enol-lactonase